MKILIVEDDQTLFQLLANELNQWGYETKGVENFNEVYEEVLHFQPELILMDVTLPYYNGFYWTEKIRKSLLSLFHLTVNP